MKLLWMAVGGKSIFLTDARREVLSFIHEEGWNVGILMQGFFLIR